MMYEIYTDGATSGNGKANAPGGWAYVILKDGRLVSQNSGAEVGTTNQRMELTAALRACEEIEAMDGFATVRLYSDSAYLINCFKQNWWKAWRAGEGSVSVLLMWLLFLANGIYLLSLWMRMECKKSP